MDCTGLFLLYLFHSSFAMKRSWEAEADEASLYVVEGDSSSNMENSCGRKRLPASDAIQSGLVTRMAASKSPKQLKCILLAVSGDQETSGTTGKQKGTELNQQDTPRRNSSVWFMMPKTSKHDFFVFYTENSTSGPRPTIESRFVHTLKNAWYYLRLCILFTQSWATNDSFQWP